MKSKQVVKMLEHAMLVFLVFGIFTATASATTIQITSGGVGGPDTGISWDHCAILTGEGLHIFTCSPYPFPGDTLDTNETFIWYYTYSSYGIFDPPNLQLHFFHEPIPAATLQFRGPEVTEPFTMTGTLTSPPGAGDPAVLDLIGQGTLHVFWQNDPFYGTHLQAGFLFTPAVPEPSSLLLLVFGLGPLVICTHHARLSFRPGHHRVVRSSLFVILSGTRR